MSADLALNEYGSRLSNLEGHAQTTERRLETVDRTLTSHSTVLEEIRLAVTKQEAVPKFQPSQWLSLAKDMALLVGLAGAAIIYIAGNLSSSPLALLKSDQESSVALLKANQEASVALLRAQQESGFLLIQKDLGVMLRRMDGAEFARNWRAETVEVPGRRP